MACKYREPGSDVWLSEAEFKQKLNEGLIDSFIINNDIKVPKFEANTDLANKFKKEAKESAPSVAEQAAPVTKAAVKEEGTAAKATESKEKPTTSKKGFISTKGNVRGKDIDGYAVRVSEDGKTADVMLPSNKMVEGLKIKETDTGRKYVVAANGATIFMPKAEAITETPKQQPKAEAKVEAEPEKKIRRRLDGIVDEGPNKSSKKAIELKNIVASSPNSFNGSETPSEAGIVDPLGKPMNRMIEAAYKNKEITEAERDLLLDGWEKTKTRYYAAKAKPGLEEFKDKVANGIRSAKMEEGLTGLNAALYNKVLDLAAKLFEKGMDAAIALSKALDTVLNQEVADGKMTEAEADAEKERILSEEGATTAKPRPAVSGIKKEVLSTEAKAKAEMDTQKMSIDDILEAGKKAFEDKSAFDGRDARDFCNAIAESTKRAPVLNAVQEAALVYYKTQIDNKLADLYEAKNKAIKNGDEKAKETLDQDIKILGKQDLDYQITAAKTGYEQGLSLFTRRFLLDQRYNLVTMINKYKSVNKGEISEEVENKFRELNDKYTQLKKELEKLQAERDAAEENETMDSLETAAKEPGKGTKAKKVSSLDGEVKVSTKMIRDFVAQGVESIEELTDKVKEAIAGEYPDATTRQVRDAITNYGRTIKPTEDVIRDKIYQLKAVGKLISELEDIEKGIKKTKNENKKNDLTDRAIDLRTKIKSILNSIPLTEEEEVKTDAERLRQWKNRARRTISELDNKIKSGDFTKGRKSRRLELDEKALDLEAEKIKLQDEFDYLYEEAKYANEPPLKRVAQTIYAIYETPKATTSGLDASAIGRQGLAFLLTRSITHPIKTYKVFKKQWEYAKNDSEYFKTSLAKIKAGKHYQAMKDSGLFLAEENTKFKAGEELFINHLANRIPILGKAWKMPSFVKGRLAGKTLVPGLDLYGKAEHVYAGFLNELRAEVFLEQVENLDRIGITYKTNPEEFKAWAKYVNYATGRGTAQGKLTGKYGKNIDAMIPIASVGIWSPRFVLSRINLLTNALTFGAGMPKYARRRAVRNTYGFLGMATAVTILEQALWGDDDEKTWKNFFNPYSSDFMKFKKGNIRMDEFTGLQQVVRTAAQFIANKKVDKSGKTVKLGKNFVDPNRFDVVGDFWYNKFNPSARYIWHQLATSKEQKEKERSEKRFLFRKEKGMTKYEEMANDLGMPLWLSEMGEFEEEAGVWGMLGYTGMGIFGKSVNVQAPKKATARRSSGGLSSGLKSNLGSGLKSNLSSGL